MLPLPGVKLRDAGVRTPDFVVVSNGRAAIIEVDGPHHYARTRKADDHDRDRHWDRRGVHTIRIASDPASLKALLREDPKDELGRTLRSGRPRSSCDQWPEVPMTNILWRLTPPDDGRTHGQTMDK